ncbi:MAG TPA: bifunctional phosphopantothenoylcysteine decarboxylase/phosphopantothenate--cysteine ligase CoaBC [Candidatus Eisenbacteria bacterium]|jgi:phosphopantothenoylcysteine decarboxylase/phosphopantothenate--cysteine ligase
MASGHTVVVGVAGGIAAYKACELVRWLKTRGHAVIVVMTPAAAEFVTPLTFQALSGNPVVQGLWGDQRPGFDLPPAAAARVGGKVEHVDVAEAADAIVVAPATADLIARLVHGEAPDALTAVILASPAPLVVCPAMDVEMWRHAATRENVAALRRRGATIVEPESGELASGLEGPGRLAAIEAIGAAVERALAKRASLAGVRVVVSAGRTEEPLDPVRVITNRSTGRMGVALAEAARDRGATVTLVAGAMSVEPPDRVTLVHVATAADMERAMLAAAREADVVLMAAAVSDFRPARPAREKVPRKSGALTVGLEPSADVLAAIGSARRPGQVLVGFALETSNDVARAREKLRAKGVDLVVLNTAEEGIGGDTNRVTLVEVEGAKELPLLSKREVAEHILERVAELRGSIGAGRSAKRGAGDGAEKQAAGGGTKQAPRGKSAAAGARA